MARFTDDLQNNAAGEVLVSGLSERVVLPDATTMFQGDYSRAGPDLVIQGPDGSIIRVVDYYSSDQTPDLYSEQGAVLTGDIVGRLAGTQNPMVYAQSGAPSGQEQIGQVETLEGAAFATRANGQRVALQVGDPVFQDDLVETADDSNLGLTFIDETVFSLSPNARMILDELVYEPGGSDNSMVMNLVQGTFVFVTGQVAPTGEMLVETPVATMGIRGTTPIIMIEGTNGNTEFGILKDPDGKIGAYELRDKLTGQTIDRVIDEGTILQLDQAGGTPNSITVDAARLAERAEAQSNAYFLHTVARARISSQQQNDNQQNQEGQPADGTDPITTESIGEDGPPDSSGLTVDPVIVVGDDGQEDPNEDGNEDPNSSGEQSSNDQGGGPASGIDTNIAPIVTNQTFQIDEDVGIAQGTLAVTDADGPGALSYDILDQPAFGAVLSNGDGTFTFIADPIFNTLQEGEVTAVSFTYQATDAAGGVSDVGTVTLQILGINDAPIATAIDIGATHEDASTLSVDLLGTALDPDFGDDLDTQNVTVTSSNPARAAIFAINNETGAFTLDPNQFNDLAVGETETLTIAYSIIDSFGGSTTNTASVIIEGRNDVPVITSVAQVGAVFDVSETAPQDPSQNAGDLNANGTLDFNDPDISDTGHTAEVTLTASGTLGTFQAVDDPALLNLFSTIVFNSPALANGTIDWDFTGSEALFDFLNGTEELVLEYSITVSDGLLTSDPQTVTVTINQANDAPVIISAAQTATLTEAIESAADDPTQNAGDLQTNGVLNFTDVDVSDAAHTPSVTLAASGNLGTFTAVNDAALLALFSTVVTNTAALADGTIAWDFTGSEALFDYLDNGEGLVLQYTIDVTDEALTSNSQTVTVTILGVNDAPVITSAAQTATLTEAIESATDDPTQNAGNLQTDGVLNFTDIDVSDTGHTTSVSLAATGTLGTFGAVDDTGLLALFTTVVTNTAVLADGTIAWDFTGSEALFDYLNNGESLVLEYTVDVSDEALTSNSQTVTITVNGVNDAPVITSAAQTATLTEAVESAANDPTQNAGNLQTDGVLNFSDVDVSDAAHTPSFTLAASGTLGTFGAVDDAGLLALFSTVVTNTTALADGTIAWDFTGSEALFDYLNDGESLVLEYTVNVADEAATSNSQTVTITVNGANDAPVITSAAQTATLSEVAESAADDPSSNAGDLQTNGVLNFTDIDVSETGHTSSVKLAASGTLGTFGAVDDAGLLALFSTVVTNTAALADGTIAWDFTGSETLFDYLSTGESLILEYTIDASDEAATSNPQTVTITIDGANDAPVIAAIAQTNLTETTDASDITGIVNVAFNDVDINDIGHTAQITNVSSSGVNGGLGGLTPAQLQSFIGLSAVNKGAGSEQGSLTATFTAGSGVFDYLAAGEKVQLDYTLEVTDGNGVSDTEIFRVEVTGTNDAPAVAGAVSGFATGGGTNSLLNPLANASDEDNGTSLSITNVQDPLPAGVTFDGSGAGAPVAGLTITNANNITLANGQVEVGGDTSDNPNVVNGNVGSLISYTESGTFLNGTFGGTNLDDGDIGTGVASDGTYAIPLNSAPLTLDFGADTALGSIAIYNGYGNRTDGSYTLKDGAGNILGEWTVSGVPNGFNTDTHSFWLTFDTPVTTDRLILEATTEGGTSSFREIQVFGAAPAPEFTFDPTNPAYDYLAAGEQATVSATYNVSDGTATTPGSVSWTVTGINDAPEITSSAQTSAVTEAVETALQDPSQNAGDLQTDGILNFTDVDVTDTGHTTSVSLSASGTRGPFGPVNDAGLLALFSTVVTNTAALADGTIAWDFTGSEALFDYLADGESLVLQYSVEASDAALTSNAQTVTITVNGANDAPTVSAAINAGTTDQDAATVAIDLLANASDIDASNDLDTANVSATSSNAGRTVTVNVDNETGQLTLDPSQFNDLDSGESETITIQYDVTDGVASTPTTATLVVNGANDAPTVSGPVDAGTTNEDASPVTIDLLANSNDVDGDDLNTIRVSVTSDNSGREVAFTVDDATGMLTIDPGQFGDLNAGESETLTVDYGVFESNLEFAAGITGQMVIPNSGFFLVVDFDAQTTATVARVGAETAPASPPVNGVVVLVNPNNDNWTVSAESYSNGVATARDTSEFTISDYTGASSTSGSNVQIYEDASSSASLNWTGNNIVTADGARTFSIDINNISFTDSFPGDLSIGSSSVTVTPDVPATATLVVEGRDDGAVIGLTAAPEEVVGAVTGDTDLSLAELSPVIDAAITRWADAGLNDEQVAQLEDITFEIADLGGDLLGRSEGGHIVIDDDAAGRGWFIDTTPLEDGEFANILSDMHLKSEIGQIPADQIDLLTSVLHEFGHELGLDHAEGPDAAGDLLFEELGTGERKLPGDTTSDNSAVVGAAPNTPEGPIANDDGLAGEFRIAPGGSIDILVSELLANDVDPNGEQFDLTEIFESTGGSASLEQVGSETVVRFTASDSAESGENGSFQYQVTNESGGVGFAMVDIIIDDMNTAV